jgi:hypothetical protein
VAVATAFAAGAPLAHAATWSVNDTTDTPAGQACPGFTGCSLREALTSTEANPGSDAILVSAGTYPLTNGELLVTQDLTVSKVGAGAATISGSNASRIFDVQGAGTDFVLHFLTLTNGNVTTTGSPAQGGAIYGDVGTTIDIESSTVSNSSVLTDDSAEGGGIWSEGAVTVNQSQVTGNSAASTGDGFSACGGGIAVVDGGDLTVDASGIIGN